MTRMLYYNSNCEEETSRLGKAIGQNLSEGMAVALNGDLGAGKTRVAKAIATGLGIDSSHVNSPTFSICVPHSGRLQMLHIDAYRIKDPTEVEILALDEHLELGFVLVVEWADRMAKALPEFHLKIFAEHQGPDQRSFVVHATDEKAQETLLAIANELGLKLQSG